MAKKDERLSVYLHVPFCAGKCGYCSFYSKAPEAGETERYLDALEKEIRRWRAHLGAFSLRTLYIGGGTPSLLPLAAWRRLLSLIEGMGECGS